MKAQENWRRHLSHLMSATLDPSLVYAMQWARDPRCLLQHGAGHRRVGAFASLNTPVCRLWSAESKRDWE